MSTEVLTSYRKNGVVIYDADGHDDSVSIQYHDDVTYDFAGKSAGLVMNGNRLELSHPEHKVPDVAKAIIELQAAFAANKESREIDDAALIAAANINTQDITNETSRATNKEKEICTELKDLTAASKEAENALHFKLGSISYGLESETKRAEAAEADEKKRAEAAEAVLTADLAAEVTRATANEQADSAKLSQISDRAKAAEAKFDEYYQTALATEEKARADKDEEIKAAIDALDGAIVTQIADLTSQFKTEHGAFLLAVSNAMSTETGNINSQQTVIYDLNKRLDFVERVLIQTFDNDPDYANNLSCNVVASVANFGLGSQSGKYRQHKIKVVVGVDGKIAEHKESPCYVRTDGMYCILKDETSGQWCMCFGNAVFNTGNELDLYKFEGGTDAEKPATNRAFGVDVMF